MPHTEPPTPPTPDTEYAGKVRHRDPETSWEAAGKQTKSKTQQLQDHLEGILSTSGPMTDDELLAHYEKLRDLRPRRYRDVTPQSVRSRRSELRAAGRVEDSGTKRPSSNGGPSIVWQATTAGRQAELLAEGAELKRRRAK